MDATEQTFPAAVLERSKEVPVVVDFWASWCAPCRALGPVLEAAVDERAGKIELVKVDTDANQRLAQDFGIQGIPAVKAFRDGAVVSEFVGVQPRAEIQSFLDALLPSEVEALVAAGDEASLRRALELQPAHAEAAVALARLLLARGERDAAEQVLEPAAGGFIADGLRSRLILEREHDPALERAFSALDEGQSQAGLDALLDALVRSDDGKDELRKVIVGVLAELGPEDELARSARRRLAAALY